MKKYLLITLTILIALIALPLFFIYSTQEGELFQCRTLESNHEFNFTTPFKEIFLDGQEGGSIHAIHFQTESPRGIVVYYHGRGGNLAKPWGKSAYDFTQHGFDVVMMDYRGFGKSQGRLNEKLLLDDATRVFNHVKNENPGLPVIVYGCSLGSGVAGYVAAHATPDMLILESPYYSMHDLAMHLKPFLPSLFIRLILKYPLHTENWIPQVACKIAIFHSIKDELIPYHSSLRLLQRAHTNSELISLDDAGHFDLTTSTVYKKELERVLDEFSSDNGIVCGL